MSPLRQNRNIAVKIAKDFAGIRVSASRLTRLVGSVCERFGLLAATVSIAIVDDCQIRRLNRMFLGRNSATDCLSFDLSDSADRLPDTEKSPRRTASEKSFELVVNGQRAFRQAKKLGHSAEAELALYITHGLLHNLGFDDRTQKQAQLMHQTEDQILRQLGFGPVYAAGSGQRKKVVRY